MIALPLARRAIGLGQNGLHLLGLQIARRMDRRFLHGHVQNLGTSLDGHRLTISNEAEEAAQCGQATVARADRVSAFLLGVLQEGLDLEGCQVAQCELGYRPVSALSHKPEEQAPCVAVGSNGVRRGISLLNHPLVKEGMKQPWERVDRFHGRTPSDACRQCDAYVRKRSFAC